MRRLLSIITGLLAVAMTVLAAAPAQAANLDSCLAQRHVCVSTAGRTLISQAQQDRLTQQIGDQPIYLVVAAAGSAGFNAAMRQLIGDLSGHDQYTVGFLDSGRKHFGAYNRGMLSTGGAAAIATEVVQQHQADRDYFGALTDFVRDVRQQAGSVSDSGAGSSSSGIWVLVVILAVLAAVVLLIVVLIVRPARRRRQEFQEAKSAAQDDLIALSNRLTDLRTDVGVQGNPDAVEEQAAALADYERGTRALDAARRAQYLVVVSRAIGSGPYHLACAEALAAGQPRPDRRPSCFFDPRHGMSVTDVSWAPPDGSPSRMVPVCADDERKIERGIEPELRTVKVAGAQVPYVNSGVAPAYWGGYGYGGDLFTGFLLGEALGSQPVFYEQNVYDGGYGGGDVGGGSDFGGGDFGGGGGDFGGGDFGGGDVGGGGDFGGGDF
jgi:hypothetical protein